MKANRLLWVGFSLTLFFAASLELLRYSLFDDAVSALRQLVADMLRVDMKGA